MIITKKYIWRGSLMPIGLLLILISTFSCSKTKYEMLERPYNNIERFSIGGYEELDSINAVIDGDEIKVYWSADAPLPNNIKPSIGLSSGATISPAAGEEVAFSEATVYTVTAEDGTERIYKLVPVINEAIPIISEIVDPAYWAWGTKYQVKINGQYFLSSEGKSNIRVYAQRLRDGFEFDLEVDEENTTKTQLVLDLPEFTAEQDSAQHRIWVQIGDFPSNSLDIWISQPILGTSVTSVTLKEAGQTIYIGDSLTFTLNLNPKLSVEQFSKYLNIDNFESAGVRFLWLEDNNTITGSAPIRDKSQVRIEGNKITLPLTDATLGAAADQGSYLYNLLDLRFNNLLLTWDGGIPSLRSWAWQTHVSTDMNKTTYYTEDREIMRKTQIKRK